MTISVFINDIKIQVKKNSTVLQACNSLKLDIPKFCFNNNLEIAGNCRMCLVEIKNSPKPVVSCAMPVMENMYIYTNTPLVKKARESVLEFLLLNHPLDCPICDQGGECDLQDQTIIYGSDKSRFFETKRVVEDKNCGPFIKTIMTRCIHCTRCVRFANDICGVDDLGTTGRGNKTEINFYIKKIFNSEFSGNVIDLCPVGALTSKPYAFKTRSWELKNYNSIDILDSLGSNIKINIFKNEIIRILPKKNDFINIEWITDKTRFFFDSLKYQRIKSPLKKINGNFNKISWEEAFKSLNNEFVKKDSSKIKFRIGNLNDLKTNFYLKKFTNFLGCKNISYETLKNNVKINTDISSNYLFEGGLNIIDDIDVCLLVNCNPREEASILNLHLKKRFKKGNFEIASIGSLMNLTYPIKNLGTNLNTFIEILEGKNNFCKKLIKSNKFLIIFGQNFLNNNKNKKIFEYTKKFVFNLNKPKGFVNILFNESGFLNFLETSFNKNKKSKNSLSIVYSINTDNTLKNNTNNVFNIYQGHHFTDDAQKSNIILPGNTYLEKNAVFINIEGKLQKIKRSLKTKTLERCDYLILNNLYFFVSKQNKSLVINNVTSYVLNYYLNNSNINLNKFIQKYNLKKIELPLYNLKLLLNKYNGTNILEKYSKTLVNSYKTINKNTNFICQN
jgi:NADH-quinone oxidoreductase subunit G